MPNRTLYFRDDQDDYLTEMVNESDEFDNRSQVVQYLINQQMQREEMDNE